MNTQPIIIEEGRVIIRPAAETVWLTQHQIADLFDVFISAVGSNIRSVLKSGILCEEKVCRHRDNGNNTFVKTYNLEMIITLAFQIQSRNAGWFREWIIKQATNPIIFWKMPALNTMLN